MNISELGQEVRLYDEFHRLIAGYVFIEAKEKLEYGQLLTWRKKKFRAKPAGKHSKLCGVANGSMKKRERDLVKFYGPIKVKVK